MNDDFRSRPWITWVKHGILKIGFVIQLYSYLNFEKVGPSISCWLVVALFSALLFSDFDWNYKFIIIRKKKEDSSGLVEAKSQSLVR